MESKQLETQSVAISANSRVQLPGLLVYSPLGQPRLFDKKSEGNYQWCELQAVEILETGIRRPTCRINVLSFEET